MNILSEAYYKSLAENEKNVHFWENYLQNLKSLDFSEFTNKLKVPALVPIGSRILFRGELKHTSELTVALGADYFVKCSLKQAEVIRQHRIKGAQIKLDAFIKEKEHLENQFIFSKQNVFETEGKEIIEYHTDEEDRAWRMKHREHVRQYKQKKDNDETPKMEITDEELWNRLEELELQEELENELLDLQFSESEKELDVDIKLCSGPAKEESFPVKDLKVDKDKSNLAIKEYEGDHENVNKVTFKAPTQTPKLDLLQQVIDRQNELENKLLELKNKDRPHSKTEQDLISKLDKMEQLDELEDEMDRLEDMIENGDEEENESNKVQQTKFQRRVSFKDDDDSETLELTFKHSPMEPNNDAFDAEKGITKPSDIYTAYSNLFGNTTTSILKKSKYEAHVDLKTKKDDLVTSKKIIQVATTENNEEIVIKDVIEKEQHIVNKIESQARPTSLFKKRRMQSKC